MRYFFVSYKADNNSYGDISVTSNCFFNGKELREEIAKKINSTTVIITFILEMTEKDFKDFYRE